MCMYRARLYTCGCWAFLKDPSAPLCDYALLYPLLYTYPVRHAQLDLYVAFETSFGPLCQYATFWTGAMQLDFIEAPCFRCGKMEIEASRRNYHVPPSNTPYTDAVEREYWTEMWRRDAVEGDEDTVFRAQRILEVIGASLQNVLGTIRNGLPPPAESEHVPVVDGGEVNMEEVNSGEVNGEVSMADSD